jgi:hypothetical protein
MSEKTAALNKASAHIAPGRDGLLNLIETLPATLRYEPGLVVVEGDYIILHGRFSGIGLPSNWIAADILPCPSCSSPGFPISGTGDLAGLRGSMTIQNDAGKHSYTFDYMMAEEA